MQKRRFGKVSRITVCYSCDFHFVFSSVVIHK